jgi:hypothetical protein
MTGGAAQAGPDLPRLGFRMYTGDWLVLAVALLVLATTYNSYWGSSLYGNQAAIFVAGKHRTSVDLYENRLFRIKGKLGESELQVVDGKIRFLSSPCDGKQCVYTGWISQSGEIAACVPNGVSVRILGPDPRFDTMNF